MAQQSFGTDDNIEVKPGVLHVERDLPQFQAPGKRGFDANFPFPLKGDRGEDSMPVRQPPDGSVFKNLSKGR